MRNFRASVDCREAARLTAVERIPAVSQVSTLPEGAEGKRQARQAVGGHGISEAVPGAGLSATAAKCAVFGRDDKFVAGRMFMVAA